MHPSILFTRRAAPPGQPCDLRTTSTSVGRNLPDDRHRVLGKLVLGGPQPGDGGPTLDAPRLGHRCAISDLCRCDAGAVTAGSACGSSLAPPPRRGRPPSQQGAQANNAVSTGGTVYQSNSRSDLHEDGLPQWGLTMNLDLKLSPALGSLLTASLCASPRAHYIVVGNHDSNLLLYQAGR